MEEERRLILTQVAEGKITPQEAASKLEDLDRVDPLPASEVARALPPPSSPAATGEIRRLRVENVAGSITVIADATVREAVAEGPHVARRDGDTMTIEAEPGGNGSGGFFFSRTVGLNFGGLMSLRIRANPDLELQVESQAGSVVVRGMRRSISAQTQAGSLTLEGFEGPLDISAQAGSVKGIGRLTQGASRIRCEAGSIKLALTSDSSVTVTAGSTLGRVHLDEAPGGGGFMVGSGTRQAVFGAGAASLDITATMGSVRVERLP